MSNAEDIYLNRAKLVMSILGVWPSPQDSIFYKIYRYFMVSIQYSFLIFQIIYIIQVWGDLEAVSEAFYLLFTQACLCFKVSVFLVNTGYLRNILAMMNGEIFKPLNENQAKMLLAHARRIKRLLLVFMISSQTTCGLWALKPLFDNAGSRSFPLKMWMPVDPNYSPQYEFGYLYQVITICISAYMFFGVDSVTFSSVIFCCAQIDIIKDKILNIGKSLKREGSNNTNKSESETNYRKFADCIVQYQNISDFMTLLEDAYHTYIFFQLSGSVGIICMSCLRMVVVDWRSVQFASIVTYLSVMLTQLYVCCWCGHELTAASQELPDAIYESNWLDQDIRLKRAMRFAMLRMSRPLVFRAGHYIALSRQTFVTVLRTSYSYFAVLNQANKLNNN